MMPAASNALHFGFLALIAAAVLLALYGVRFSALRTSGAIRMERVALGIVIWMTLTAGLAASGLAARWDARPPPLMACAFIGVLTTIIVARGRLGRQIAMEIPTLWLIAFQGFRFPLELLLDRAYQDGIMPVQMSYHGYNFDILTGLLGITLGFGFILANKEIPQALAWAFNIIGLGLLFNIVTIAVVSMPVIAAFGPDEINKFVTDLPYIWLPTVFVPFALFGHLALSRRLLSERPASAEAVDSETQ